MSGPDPRQPDYGGLTIALAVEDERWAEVLPADLESFCHDSFAAAARELSLPGNLETEISVTFADDATVRVANAEWRGKDKPTNILSFPMPAPPGQAAGPLLGDLLLAFETVQREAAAEGKSLPDHLRHLLVHGFLHLLGQDHVEAEEADRMEALEIRILASFGIADPYVEQTGVD